MRDGGRSAFDLMWPELTWGWVEGGVSGNGGGRGGRGGRKSMEATKNDGDHLRHHVQSRLCQHLCSNRIKTLNAYCNSNTILNSCTMPFGSAANLLAKQLPKYHRISWCPGYARHVPGTIPQQMTLQETIKRIPGLCSSIKLSAVQ